MSRKHAVFAPSSTSRWLICPISAVMAARLPERSSASADEGTRVHKLIEDAIITKSIAHVPEDDQWAVELTLDYVAKLGDGAVYPEQRIQVNDDIFGTVDIIHAAPGSEIVTIADYKNGGFDVPAAWNKQLLTYAVGVLRGTPAIKWFRFAIIQPNSKTHGDVEPIKQWVAPVSAVVDHGKKIEKAVERANQGEPPTPGKHCRWCPAFGECEATKPVLRYIERAIEMPPTQIPDDHIVRIAQVLRGLDDFKKIVDEEINSRLLKGKPVAGAELEHGRAFRQWRDEFMAKRRLHELFGLDALEPISPAKAEKLGAEAREVVQMLSHKPKGKLRASY